MDNLHRYQSYRLRRRPTLVERGKRWLMVIVVVIVLVLLWRGLRSGGPKSSTEPNENISPLVNTTVAVNGNANAAPNTNTAVTPGSFSLAKCPKVISNYGEQPRIALTFNGGTGKGATEQILQALKNANLTATFFFTGQWVEQNSELAKQVVAAGNTIDNYTYDRPHVTKITAEELTGQLTKAEAAIQTATGRNPQPFFRPPYGEFNEAVLATAKTTGYCVITWTVDSLDWQDGQTLEGAQQRVLDKAKPGAIVLMNVGSDLVTELLPAIITELRAKGYELVNLEALLGA